VDSDLAWTLLGVLVAHGAAGTAEIDAAADADPTASGERRATQVRALRPELDAKRAMWERLIGDDGMANALQEAAISGFGHPAQVEVLASFVKPYFDEVAAVWARRSIEVAQKVAVGLYPRWAIGQTTLDAAAAWSAQERPPSLRRLVSEGTSTVERAIAARAADAG
jgi:aminopeptidase N